MLLAYFLGSFLKREVGAGDGGSCVQCGWGCRAYLSLLDTSLWRTGVPLGPVLCVPAIFCCRVVLL